MAISFFSFGGVLGNGILVPSSKRVFKSSADFKWQWVGDKGRSIVMEKREPTEVDLRK